MSSRRFDGITGYLYKFLSNLLDGAIMLKESGFRKLIDPATVSEMLQRSGTFLTRKMH
jgi:hypothetical protein